MALTRHFRETIQTRAQEDPEYRQALLAEAMNCFLSGEIEIGKSLLRDYINATVGFEALAKAVGKSSKVFTGCWHRWVTRALKLL
jgi:hypothetical protein